MKLGKHIYNEEGRVLLAQHVELSATLITRLERYGVSMVYIDDPMTEDVEIVELISDETRLAAMRTLRTQFRKMMGGAAGSRTYSRDSMGSAFRSTVDMIIGDLSANKDAMIMLSGILATDHYLYQHSLNVCIYATLLGMKHGYSRQQLELLSLGALLHDVGKTRIPYDILIKPGKLTDEEYDVMKRHSKIGYDILRQEPNIPLLSAHCAYQHHERMNGSGYPRGLSGEDIHEFARWIGMVDVYDAMTTYRTYRDAMLPHQAVEILYAGSGSQFEKDKLELFRDSVAIYPLGLDVTLNTGERGVVVDLNANVPHRPIVRVLYDPSGGELQTPYEVDLTRKLSIMITGVLEDRRELVPYSVT